MDELVMAGLLGGADRRVLGWKFGKQTLSELNLVLRRRNCSIASPKLFRVSEIVPEIDFALANAIKFIFLLRTELNTLQNMLKTFLLNDTMASRVKILFGLLAIMLIVGAFSCGTKQDDDVGFLKWYLSEFRKGAEEMRAREIENEAQTDRSRRFWMWVESTEGQRAIAARTEQVLTSPYGIPDTVYEMSFPDFKISSRSTGMTLTGSVHHRDSAAQARLHRADGSTRDFIQGASATLLGYLGEGQFDEDDRLVAALLRDNPRPGWPGRALEKTHPKRQTIAAEMWQKMTGEELRYYSSGRKGK
jgi:hypothetical protein